MMELDSKRKTPGAKYDQDQVNNVARPQGCVRAHGQQDFGKARRRPRPGTASAEPLDGLDLAPRGEGQFPLGVVLQRPSRLS